MGFNLQCQDAYETEVGYGVFFGYFMDALIDEVFMFHQEILFALHLFGLRLVGKCTGVHCGGIGVYFPAKVCEALAALPLLIFFAWEYMLTLLRGCKSFPLVCFKFRMGSILI